MAAFSATDCATSGFSLIKQRPVSALVWALVWLVLGLAPMLYAMQSLAPKLIDMMHDVMATRAADAHADRQEVLGRMMALNGQMNAIMAPYYLWLLVLSSVMSAAIYRSILEPSKRAFAYLRLGGDEFRLIVLQLIYVVLAIVFGVLLAVVGGVVIGVVHNAVPSPWGGWLTLLAVLALIAVCVWIPVRLSLAAPMTFADKKLRIFDSWRVTGGHFWSLLGMWLMALLLVIVIAIVFAMIAQAVFWSTGGGEMMKMLMGLGDEASRGDPAQILKTVFTNMGPAIVIVLAISGIRDVILRILYTAPGAAAYQALTSHVRAFDNDDSHA